MSKVVWISDMNMSTSGYFNISVATCSRLVNLGHDVRVIGYGYEKEEHNFNFPIIPARSVQDLVAITGNLKVLWDFDVLIVAFDIWMHEQIILRLEGRKFKYYGIMPVESDPLCISWGMVMMQMDKAFVISKFGTIEARKIGVTNVEPFLVGIDADAWRLALPEERERLRLSFGIQDRFAVLTVADNQERKNLSRSMEIFADFARQVPNSVYILVTRENAMLGWKLREYAQELGISDKLMIYERGMPFIELWGLTAACDCFLLTSKAEGSGIPILEAMSVGIPCLGTNCTGIKENLADDRGILIPPDYSYRDPFGNGFRYFASRSEGAKLLMQIYDGTIDVKSMTSRARDYIVNHRSWDASVNIIQQALLNEEKHGKTQAKDSTSGKEFTISPIIC